MEFHFDKEFTNTNGNGNGKQRCKTKWCAIIQSSQSSSHQTKLIDVKCEDFFFEQIQAVFLPLTGLSLSMWNAGISSLDRYWFFRSSAGGIIIPRSSFPSTVIHFKPRSELLLFGSSILKFSKAIRRRHIQRPHQHSSSTSLVSKEHESSAQLFLHRSI